MLRLVEIAQRKRVLDLGTGYGIIASELCRRTSGSVIALDVSREALKSIDVTAVCGDARRLPFLSGTFDLAFSQNVLLWIHEQESVVEQVNRVLIPGGSWLLFEPDYGGMIEFPDEASRIWIDVLQRNGADPFIGRRLPSLLKKAGFRTRIELLPRLSPPADQRFDFLLEMQLTQEERSRIQSIQNQVFDGVPVSHLPYFMIIADRP